MPRASVDRPPEKDVRTTKNLEQDRLTQLDQNRFEGVLETVFRQAPVFEPLLWLPLLPSDRAGGVVLSPGRIIVLTVMRLPLPDGPPHDRDLVADPSEKGRVDSDPCLRQRESTRHHHETQKTESLEGHACLQ